VRAPLRKERGHVPEGHVPFQRTVYFAVRIH